MDIILIFIIAFLFLAIGFYARSIIGKKKSKTTVNSVIMLEKIKKVAKLITIEGSFAEIYHYEDVSRYFINLIPRTKKALLVIKAKASVGYDLRKMKLETDEENQKIIITHLPKPEILAIDEQVQFYDKKQSWPNVLTAEDLNQISKSAKEFIRENIEKSELPEIALHQGEDIINTIKTIAAATGWKVEIQAKSVETKQKEKPSKSFVNILPNKNLN